MESLTRRLSGRKLESSRRPSLSESTRTINLEPLAFRFLDTDTIEKYATILAWQPPTEKSKEQARKAGRNTIETLLPSAKPRKKSGSRTLSWSGKPNDKDDNVQKICSLHRGLHPTILSTAISGLERIVNVDVERVLSQSHLNESFSVSDIYHLQSAQDILATRLLLQDFCLRFRRSPRQSWYTPTHALEDVRCDACKLTKVSSHPASLVGLRATIVAGLATGVPRYDQPCALLELIEMWIGIYEKQQAIQLLFKSAQLASKIKALPLCDQHPIQSTHNIPSIQLRAALGIASLKLHQNNTDVNQRAKEITPESPEAGTATTYPQRVSRSLSSRSARSAQLPETTYPMLQPVAYRKNLRDLGQIVHPLEPPHQWTTEERNSPSSSQKLQNAKEPLDLSQYDKVSHLQQRDSLSKFDSSPHQHIYPSTQESFPAGSNQDATIRQQKPKFSLSNLSVSVSPLRRSSSSSKTSHRIATTNTSSTSSRKRCLNSNDLTSVETWTEPVPLSPAPQNSHSYSTWTPPRYATNVDGSPASTIAASLGVLEDAWREANSIINKNTDREAHNF